MICTESQEVDLDPTKSATDLVNCVATKIEHLWAHIGRQLRGRRFRNGDELFAHLQLNNNGQNGRTLAKAKADRPGRQPQIVMKWKKH
uniref:Transposase n=1 Tax=Globodera pallida TaxID=36090 RepID=A0A183C3M7_GLOPA